jgi:alpha-tubulin suppressor-like RCC1 family protein
MRCGVSKTKTLEKKLMNVKRWIIISSCTCCGFLFAFTCCTGKAPADCSTNSVGGGGSLDPSCATGGNNGTGGAFVSPGNVKFIAAGDQVACALLNNNTIKCWGHNDHGQLGNGTTTTGPVSTPVQVLGISNATTIVSVGWSSCAILSDATVKCWGQNDYSQVGSAAGANAPTPVAVPNVSNATALALGWNHSCALISDSTVKCWGRCSEKQCGDGASGTNAPPTTVSGVSGVKAISAYDYHTCAIMSDDTVKCWGQTNLGTAATTVNQNPTTVVNASQQAITGVTMIASGKNFDLAVNASGMYAWGNGNTGTLGDGQMTSRLTAALVSGITNPKGISARYLTACALLQDGTVDGWGENDSGMLGIDSEKFFIPSPQLIPGLTGVTQIAVGQSTTCALKNGNVYCLGSNYNGELGNGGIGGTGDKSLTPVQVIGL